ncbi:MAG: AMP-binding protein [Colwellia sp.]|nr:AMP-binding protein [Colwellia sp.]
MLIDKLSQFPLERVALQTLDSAITYQELINQVNELSDWLILNHIESVALFGENKPQWLIIDLACQRAKIMLTPVPAFFSPNQIKHLLDSVKPTILFADQTFQQDLLMTKQTLVSPISEFQVFKLGDKISANIPKNTSKITFTSGSTGEPKGVCLSIENQLNVANSLVNKIAIDSPVHLCLLSFATLLENIAGVYAPLLAGGTIWIISDLERGFNGAELTNLNKLLNIISISKPQTLILVPELLQILLLGISKGWQPPQALEFIAVGGSRVSEKLITKAKLMGLPVYQGYGLSECGSVVSINSKNTLNTNGVGEVLDHLSTEIIDGELIVTGNSFLGYLELPDSWYQDNVATGDLVTIVNGNLEIKGRKKNLIINSYGRNISPEWLESELTSTGLFRQAVVFGDSKPFCIAILVPLSANISRDKIQSAINELNKSLPIYAQIDDFILLTHAMTFIDGLVTSNGRPKRSAIAQHYHQELSQLYSNHLQTSN